MSIFGQKKTFIGAVITTLVLVFFTFWAGSAWLQNGEGDGPATLDWLAAMQAVALSSITVLWGAMLSMILERIWFGLFYDYTVGRMEKDFWEAIPSEVVKARWRLAFALVVRLVLFVCTVFVITSYR